MLEQIYSFSLSEWSVSHYYVHALKSLFHTICDYLEPAFVAIGWRGGGCDPTTLTKYIK